MSSQADNSKYTYIEINRKGDYCLREPGPVLFFALKKVKNRSQKAPLNGKSLCSKKLSGKGGYP